MIVFLTLCYVGLLALAIKLGFIRLTLFWKLSPVLWMVLLFVALFLPMQWGAPGGSVNLYQPVVEIIPNVSGEVIEVPVEPLVPLKKGDVLFKIDPVPFQAKVDQLTAKLADTIQNVERLEASAEAADALVRETEEQIDVKQAEADSADAKVVIAETLTQQETANLAKAKQLVTDLTSQVTTSQRNYDRQLELQKQAAASQSEVDRSQIDLTQRKSDLNQAESDLLTAEQQLAGSMASLDSQKAEARAVRAALKQLVDATLPRSQSLAREAHLLAESTIAGEHTSVAMVRADLAAAQYDLEQTTVRAPSDGNVVFLTLRPGQRVAALPMRSWIAFVNSEEKAVVAQIDQFALRHVRSGQPAEVTLKLYPGKVFEGKVSRIANVNSSAQLQPSGQIEAAQDQTSAEAIQVLIGVDDPLFDELPLAGGARGSAAIYTESASATHVIRRVMIRMDAWMNYILP